MGKGEIANYKLFLLFPQYFQKTHKNQGFFGKWLAFYQKTNFKTGPDSKHLLTTKQMCIKKHKFSLGWEEKHCGKRRKCWLPAFSPFPTMFSKGFFSRVVKSQDRVVEG